MRRRTQYGWSIMVVFGLLVGLPIGLIAGPVIGVFVGLLAGWDYALFVL